MKKKYKLTDETKEIDGHILHRIVALKKFSNVKNGEKGGWVESESNLSQKGDCWICGNAVVYNNATVRDNAIVCDMSRVFDNAQIFGNVKLFDNAKVYGDVRVFDNAEIYGNTKVFGNSYVCGYASIGGNSVVNKTSDYAVYTNTWSFGEHFTYTRSNKKWNIGCFYGTGKNLIKMAYKESKLLGDCYKAVVEMQEKIDKLIEEEK